MFHVLRLTAETWNMSTERNVDVESRVKELFLECKLMHSRLFNDRVELVTDLVSDAVPEIARVERRKRQGKAEGSVA